MIYLLCKILQIKKKSRMRGRGRRIITLSEDGLSHRQVARYFFVFAQGKVSRFLKLSTLKKRASRRWKVTTETQERFLTQISRINPATGVNRKRKLFTRRWLRVPELLVCGAWKFDYWGLASECFIFWWNQNCLPQTTGNSHFKTFRLGLPDIFLTRKYCNILEWNYPKSQYNM